MSKKILIVDDDVNAVQFLMAILKEPEFVVNTAQDGLDALEQIKADRPDLIILDLMMPKMDGFHVCRMIKFNDELKDIPVIILTAREDEQDVKTAKEVKADQYIRKPIDGNEILKAVNTFLK